MARLLFADFQFLQFSIFQFLFLFVIFFWFYLIFIDFSGFVWILVDFGGFGVSRLVFWVSVNSSGVCELIGCL